MITKNIAKLAATLALTLTGAGLASAETLQVGANIGNVPWEFQDETGDFVGFEIDLVTEGHLDFCLFSAPPFGAM